MRPSPLGRGLFAGLAVVMVALAGAIAATPNSFFATTSTSPVVTTTTTTSGSWSCTATSTNGTCPASTWSIQPGHDSNFTGANFSPSVTTPPGSWGIWAGINDQIGQTETLNWNSPQNYQFIWSTNNPGLSISGYPNTGTYAYSGPVDDYTSLTTTNTNQTAPTSSSTGNSNLDGWTMTETYYTQPGHPTAEVDNEISIQVNFLNPSTAACSNTMSQAISGINNGFGNPSISSVSNSASSGTSATVTLTGGPSDATPLGIHGASGTSLDNVIIDHTTAGNIPSGTTVISTSGSTMTLSPGVTNIQPGDVLYLANSWSYGIIANDLSIGGSTWHFCDGGDNHQTNGYCATNDQYCGQYVLKAGCDEGSDPSSTSVTDTIDLKAIVSWMESHAAPDNAGISPGNNWGTVDDPCSSPWQPASGSQGTDPAVEEPTVGASGTNTITVPYASQLSNGQAVIDATTGTNVPASTTISSISGNVVTLNHNLNASVVGDALKFGTQAANTSWAAYPYIVPRSSIYNISQGWEIRNTGGSSYTFAGNGFQINATGTVTPCAAWPGNCPT
jgi:hypothetical protein